jgi:ATP-dependent RNA helicase SUPV3L1/SUV3
VAELPASDVQGDAPTAEPAADQVEIEVWWPRDTGPFRHHKPKQAKARPQGLKERKPKPKFERPRRPEKPVDPNSPFAVLGQLKSQMAGQKR